jgi:hypothetical protein
VDDQEMLAAIGQVIVSASVLEWEVAVLAALSEGTDPSGVRDRVRHLASSSGAAVRRLAELADADPRIRPLLRDVKSVLDSRHILAHSVMYVVGKGEDEDFAVLPRGQAVDFGGEDELMVIWHPRTDWERHLPLRQLRLQAQDLRIAFDRVQQAVAERKAEPEDRS